MDYPGWLSRGSLAQDADREVEGTEQPEPRLWAYYEKTAGPTSRVGHLDSSKIAGRGAP